MRDARPGVRRLAARARRRRARRASTRARSCGKIRDGGVLRCALGDAPVEELRARALAEPFIDGRPLDRQVGAQEPYSVGAGPARGRRRPRLEALDPAPARRRRARGATSCPATWDADAILEADPRVVLIANGPGDPAVLTEQIETIRALLGRVPLFGVCLGHQLLGLALGHETFKLPVRPPRREPPRARRRRPAACSSPSRTTASPCSPNGDISHVSLNDGTCEGLAGDGFASVQFHPEASPGPARRPALLRPPGRRVPKRTDLRSILILGSGPIRIGQACEFDYSGAQACRVLRREGYRVVLVNSNPATIMTDPEWADATYLEPLDAETVARGDRARAARRDPADARRADGAQPRGRARADCGDRADRRRPRRDPAAEDRELFRDDGARRRASRCRAAIVATRPTSTSRCRRSCGRRSRSAAPAAASRWTPEELRAAIAHGLAASPVGQVLVEEYLARLAGARARGDVRRARATRSSSARSRTSTRWASTPATRGRSRRSRRCPTRSTSSSARRRSRPRARSASRPAARTSSSPCIRRRDEYRVIEMNPRVSRSSALASKATGFPIAKLAALLAVGFTLDELPNDITGKTTAAFEPALDYVAVKAPRFDFEKFPRAERRLGAEMRAVGEALGLGRTFPEAFMKAMDGREAPPVAFPADDDELVARAAEPRAGALGPAARGGAARARAARDPPVLRRPAARDRGLRPTCAPAGRRGSRSTRAPASSRRGRRTTTSRTRARTRGRSRRDAR